MKFCKKCGNAITDKAKFCKKCGAPVRSQAKPVQPNTLPRKGKKSFKMPIYTAIAVVILVSLGLGVYFLRNPPGKKIIFDPEEPLTRVQLARIIVEMFETPTETELIFSDVPESSPGNIWVTAAVERGIIIPIEHGEILGADEQVTGAELITWLVRALGVGTYDENDGLADEISTAGKIGLISAGQEDFLEEKLTHGQGAEYITSMSQILENLTPTFEPVFHTVYHSNVVVLNHPPQYSVVENDNLLTITIDNADDAVRRLNAGDTFVFEQTEDNPMGISGRLINISNEGDTAILTAAIPESLDEIFSEFEFSGTFDMLANAPEILIAEELQGMDGIEIRRNPTRLVSVDLDNLDIWGIRLNGNFTLYNPELRAYISNRPTKVNLYVETSATFDMTASTSHKFDRVIPLFTIPVPLSVGVSVDVQVGLRVTAEGEFSLEYNARLDNQFGIMDNLPFARTKFSHDFAFDYNIKASLARNIQLKIRVFGIPTYGAQGDFGRGFFKNTEMQQMCPTGECSIIGLFKVERIRSLIDWGALKNVQALRFDENYAAGKPYDFRFRAEGAWHRQCLHGGVTEFIIHTPGIDGSESSLLGESNERVTLEEAQRNPGLYIKDGDKFIYFEPQWSVISSQARSTVAMVLYPSQSEMMAILFEPTFEIPKIPQSAQLVLIGQTDIDIYQPIHEGWTVPLQISIGEMPGSAFTGASARWESLLLGYETGNLGMPVDRSFETINGKSPGDFVDRMIYTRSNYNLMRFHGLLTGTANEPFAFAWWQGTEYVEKAYTADRRFFTLESSGHSSLRANRADFEIVRTLEGYFEVNFITPPSGYYAIGNRIAEFTE